MIGAITGGLVVDGTGAEPIPATVLLADGRITAVLPGDTEPPSGAGLPSGGEVIDAGGNVIAPGFIDLHSHADFSAEASPAAITQLHQGATTLVTGNCGWSPFPIADLEQLRVGTAFLAPESSWSWHDAQGFADTLDGASSTTLTARPPTWTMEGGTRACWRASPTPPNASESRTPYGTRTSSIPAT